MKKPAENPRPILDLNEKHLWPAWIGKMVHYVENVTGAEEGTHRAAIINYNWDGTGLCLTILGPQRIYSVPLTPKFGETIATQDEQHKKIFTWHHAELPEDCRKPEPADATA